MKAVADFSSMDHDQLDDDDNDDTSKTLVTCRLPLPNREDHWDFVLKEEDADEEEDDDDDGIRRSSSLNLSLNYQKVLDAWSDRGSLWADFGHNNNSLSNYTSNSAPARGYVAQMGLGLGLGLGECTSRGRRREASVLRYKQKRHSRLFAKKIRYQVRKLNADQRPRLKGRFVKRSLEKIFI